MGPWMRRLMALLAGAAAAFAHPPFGFLPGLLGYAALMMLAQTEGPRPLRSAFLMGWLAGLTYFAIATWWIAEAFFVDAAAHGWMAPFAVTFMAGGLALFWGAAALAFRAVAAKGLVGWLVFTGVLTGFEWLRGHVLTGFPWDLPGETWRAGSAVSQGAALVGAYGMTWLTLLIATAPALLWRGQKGSRIAIPIAAVLLAGLFGWGQWRLAQPEPIPVNAPTVRIVQANIPQEAKYDLRLYRSIVARYANLTSRPPAAGERRPDIVVWPEGALPISIDDYLAPGQWTRQQIEAALQPGQFLMVGAWRSERIPRGVALYNTFVAVRRDAVEGLVPLALYDKFRLVPFGEYLPLDGLLAPLGVHQLVQVGEGFRPGPRPRPIAPPGLPVMQPLICYESLYPGFTREGAIASGRRAGVIVNVSNDAWFGATSGPLQHLNLASYRAIEEGLPMLRATPTGVSAVIDAHGRIRTGFSLEHGRSGVIDASIPGALGPTLYARFGDTLFAGMMILSGLATGLAVNQRLRQNDRNPKWGGKA